jgi:hypothetical protein
VNQKLSQTPQSQGLKKTIPTKPQLKSKSKGKNGSKASLGGKD